MAAKPAQRLLTVHDLVFLLGISRQQVARMMQDPAVWARPGGAKFIAGEYRLPESFYNRWVDAQDVALAAARR